MTVQSLPKDFFEYDDKEPFDEGLEHTPPKFRSTALLGPEKQPLDDSDEFNEEETTNE